MGREEVARNQRARIYGAMIESVSRNGYRQTTVADVIALAGVSRRAFYEQFSNKEDCFLGTYDIVVARARKGVVDAWQAERGWSNRLHAACSALLTNVALSPKGPRLVLVDALGIGPPARERMQLAGVAFERLIATIFQLAPDGVEVPPLAARAIVGGVRHLAFVRLRDGRERELPLLVDDVLDWIEAYRSPLAIRLGPAPPENPERRAPAPARFLLADDTRARALRSIVHLTLDKGYGGLTDAQVADFADISTDAFHKCFASKESAFLAVLDEFVEDASATVRERVGHSLPWPQAVHRGMGAFVDHLIAHQALLRIAFIELFEVGPAMVSRMTASIDALTEELLAGSPPPRRGPPIAREAVTGAVWAIVSSCITAQRVSRLPGLVDHLAFVVLAPYLGPKAALAEIQAARIGGAPAS
jgi:AcrR family transcriptional regulator